MRPRLLAPPAPAAFLLTILSAGVLLSCGRTPRLAEVERDRFLMGTLCNVVVRGRDAARAESAAAAALDEIARLESVMSSWRKDSELWALNHAAGRERVCSPDLFAVLNLSVAYAEASDGAFDPTIEPLAAAWDLRGAGRVPSSRELARARSLVGWRRLHLDRSRRVAMLETGSAVDLGGIGKGFALDRAEERLRAAGVEGALLNFGGELLAFGASAEDAERGWRITIAHPADRLRPVVGFQVRDRAVSTSAQSERGFTAAAHHYGHVLDPRTGVPVESPASVTVVAASATRADAMSTALLVAGREAARAWASRHPEDGVIWLEPAGSAVRMWSWNAEPRSLPGARVTRMDSAADGRSSPP